MENLFAFYSRKLSPTQTRYSTTERELLAVMATLKEYQNNLLGQEISIKTSYQEMLQLKGSSDGDYLLKNLDPTLYISQVLSI